MALKLKRIRDQVIVITGASSGIGLTTAEMAAGEGARVVLNSRNETDLRKACERIAARGGRAVYIVGDVADPDAMEMVANRATFRVQRPRYLGQQCRDRDVWPADTDVDG